MASKTYEFSIEDILDKFKPTKKMYEYYDYEITGTPQKPKLKVSVIEIE